MPEGFDPKLKDEWEEKLRNAGLSENLSPIGRRLKKVPEKKLLNLSDTIDKSLEKEIFNMPDIEIKMSLEKFGNLPEEMRNVILEDIKKHKDTGMSLEKIKQRVYFLVEGSHKLNAMTEADSDESYKPTPPKEETIDETEDERKEREERIDELIQDMEKISRDKGSTSEDPKEETVN